MRSFPGEHASDQWCLDCHRNPEMALRPLDQVSTWTGKRPEIRRNSGAKFAQETKKFGRRLTDQLPTCHR